MPTRKSDGFSQMAQSKARKTLNEFWRVRWMIVIPVAVMLARSHGWLGDSSVLTLMLYKPALGCIGMVAGHLAWSQCFFYVDMGDLLRREQNTALLAIAVIRGLIYASFILGVTLGL